MFCKHCGNELIPGNKFCTKCGNEGQGMQAKKRGGFITRKKLIIFAVAVIIIFFLFIYKAPTSTEQRNQDIASSVVNIFCEGASGTYEDGSGGSGTIITADGLVLTNSHIIPQGENESLNEKSCIVTLPDPATGAEKDIYYAKPLVAPDISEKYDLAFVQIDDVYYDEKEGKAYGEYPRQFPAYDSSLYCKKENIKLGESVRIYGYPAISGGGYALTITDGIVSSLIIDEGLIITSAKISHGNSGGLAVDKNGCRIGIPSMVSGDEYESLGVIISNNLISDFTEEVDALINNQK
ncbi:MAG: trypsin-like peptidase domain-containing protein [Candidatus Levybacteria bacterium]|nr:trypsin-like peptidase domain-containing protein [Candidatus Levybacteria bacterium]